jgi:excisionase family DNA binding protein
MEDLIKPGVAASMLGISTETLRNWERAGKIKAVKTLGGHHRYNIHDIEKIKRNEE